MRLVGDKLQSWIWGLHMCKLEVASSSSSVVIEHARARVHMCCKHRARQLISHRPPCNTCRLTVLTSDRSVTSFFGTSGRP